ncbi:MAG: CdaR family protein [Balneolaceae bacterium]
MELLKKIGERIRLFLSGEVGLAEEPDRENFTTKKKIIAFTVALILSLSLWFIVNMGRDYSVTIQLPIQVVNLPEGVALSGTLPDHASVSLNGEGWKLINFYSNPPQIQMTAEARQVNLLDLVRQQVGSASDVTIIQVDPVLVTIETEEEQSVRVPIRNRVDITLRDQFGFLGEPSFEPDSITISGPASQVQAIEEWESLPRTITDVYTDVSLQIPLEEPPAGLRIDTEQATLTASVSEFTEAEVRIPIRTRNLPPGQAVTFNPSSIMVRFDVPIDQFADVQNIRPYAAFVEYSSIQDDDTGLISPEIETITTDFDVRLRSFQPSRVSYFNIVPD